MVSLEDLAALDLQIWQRTGLRAGALSDCNQSTVSRRIARTLGIFRLRLRRQRGEWQLLGGTQLLQLERHLHQLARFQGYAPLRLELSPHLGPFLSRPAPEGWVLGPMDHVGVTRPLQLLRERVIDAWVFESCLDLPGREDPSLALLPLFGLPVWLLADRHHPLAAVERPSPGDLARFPSLTLPREHVPTTTRMLAELGFGTVGVEGPRYDPDEWEGLSRDRATLVYGTPFNRRLLPSLVRLRRDPLFLNQGALVCRSELAGQGAIAVLHAWLLRRISALLPRLEGLEPLT